jgi:hypothetical protein
MVIGLILGGGTVATSMASETMPLSITEAPTAAIQISQAFGPTALGPVADRPMHAEMAGAALIGGYLLYRSRRRRMI